MSTHTTPPSQRRLGAGALALAGVLFFLYNAVRPWRDETTVAGAEEALSSAWWIVSHLCAMLGFVLVTLGFLAVRSAVQGTPGQNAGRKAVVAGIIGTGLTLPYYGAETFGLHAVAAAHRDGASFDLLDVTDAVRFDPTAATMFVTGLVVLAVAAVHAALAVRRSGVLARHSGSLVALGFVLFIPQFFGPAPVRIAHGVLLTVGSAWLAWALWRAEPNTAVPRQTSEAAGPPAFTG
ncbi:hypothetical protein G1H11_14830 [Phytoactinopolyspora alkaliphila]|uniref:DUF998 domain-containing protein n=1 Tax=Phytoactinopolyspora alkaliphila TaxID=1783498 RepID=A0A6N9YNK5_9ACTN|nr:hypothetical protein [Phytoactinopolyspora alkaliphila]NED96583.1 hypothetical protein [Phytoactinopolyspora alkaliphila]